MDRPTLAKLAKELGVSTTTISNAFRRPDQLSAGLRERILERAHSMQFYGPDPAGSMLRTGRSSLVGLGLFHDTHRALGDPHMTDVIRGVSAVLDRHDLGLVLLPRFGVKEPSRDPVPFPVDGLIIYSPYLDRDFLSRLGRRDVPVVSVDAQHPHLASITIDDRAGAKAAADHVLDLGHERIAILTFDLFPEHRAALESGDADEVAMSSITMRRLLGYRDALTARGIDFADVPLAEANVEDEAVAATEELLRRPGPPPTAFLCMSDQLALGAYRALASHGSSVPDDASVVGFDDIPAARAARPALTTVRQDAFRKGELAAEAVIAESGPQSLQIPVELVDRSSTAPAAR